MDDAQLSVPQPPRRTPAPGAEPCRAGDLTAGLDRWYGPVDTGERGGPPPGSKLIGYVTVRNRATQECTLQGETPTRLFHHGRELPLAYASGINQEARQRVTVVPPGGAARLRVDWSAPFCEELTGDLELRVQLPNQGGELRAPVTPTDTPACGSPGAVPDRQGSLYASGFDEPPTEIERDSPLHDVTIEVDGPDSAAPGERVTYYVTIHNPTAAPIPLDPCPGYTMELFSQGDMDHRAVNTSQLYRLNCRPLRHLPARDSVRFEMVTHVPETLTAGRELAAGWRLQAQRFVPGEAHWGNVVLTIT